jgi:hypothetical protein
MERKGGGCRSGERTRACKMPEFIPQSEQCLQPGLILVHDRLVNGRQPRLMQSSHGIAPAPKRRQVTSWKDFLAAHNSLLAGCDFFTVEVLSWRGLVTCYVLFFIHLESRRVQIAGITRHPNEEWMEQIGRSATQETFGYLYPCRYVLHDCDTKFCASFRSVLATGGVKAVQLPAKSPNLKRSQNDGFALSNRNACPR